MASNCSGSHDVQADGEMLAYKKSALSVISFKIVYDENDINEDGCTFHPEMAHQIFGDSESIFGYRSLSIYIYYLHNSCKCYVNIKASGKIDQDNLKADNIIEKLEDWIPKEYCTEPEKMLKFVEHEKHDTIYGKVIDEFEDKIKANQFDDTEIFLKYKITKPDTLDEDFQQLHSRFETLIVWYIDGANGIDLTDNRWLLYYVYEEFQHPDHPGEIFRSPIGFCSVYKFFLYPESTRARISQFFVLPSHQRRGIGTHLYEVVVNDLRQMEDIVDITVEEPTETFQKLREVIDCSEVHKKIKSENVDINSDSHKAYDIMKSLKLCNRQQKRIIDILSGAYAKEKDPMEYRKFSKRLQDRMATEIEKEGRLGKRFKEFEMAIKADKAEKCNQIESKHKKYLEELEETIDRFRKHLSKV